MSCDEILFAEADVVAPCALGAILNETSIPKLKTTIIAGAANNQLEKDTDGMLLRDHKILYAPDYVINAGGLMNVYAKQKTDLALGSFMVPASWFQSVNAIFILIFATNNYNILCRFYEKLKISEICEKNQFLWKLRNDSRIAFLSSNHLNDIFFNSQKLSWKELKGFLKFSKIPEIMQNLDIFKTS